MKLFRRTFFVRNREPDMYRRPRSFPGKLTLKKQTDLDRGCNYRREELDRTGVT